ncbi:2-oxoacid:acceptor oxidoreductase family protein [Actinomyces sp. F1_1611]
MVEIRIHGRGGQGVVTAADMFATAAFSEGHYAQAFPSFGSERTGAPVVSYCRISDQPIRTREPVLEPDILIVQDPTLLAVVDVFAGLKPGGFAIVNTTKSVAELHLPDLPSDRTLVTIPASDLAKRHVGKPLPNAALMGAVAAATGVVKLSSVEEAIRHRFRGHIANANVAAAQDAYEYLRAAGSGVKEEAHASAN